MKIRHLILSTAAGCMAGMAVPAPVSASVSDEAFNALADMVSKQGQMIEALQKTHDQDQQKIQQLEQLTTSAVQKAEAAGQTQPVYQAPNPATTTTHNFMVIGDAEVQFGNCLLYTSPSPRDGLLSRMPSSA